jgi:hypothetical protein
MPNEMIVALIVAGLVAVLAAVSRREKGQDASGWETSFGGEGPDGWVIEIPMAPGSLRYVTMPTQSLAGKRSIRMVYEVETDDPATRIVPRNFPESPSILALYFQREGDNWSGSGKYEAYRWYASGVKKSPIVAGKHEIEASFEWGWTGVMTSSINSNPWGFREALEHAHRVGFVLGGGDGLGHGVRATGPARIRILSFSVE